MTNEHIHELLAFRANGTLEGEDLATVEAALDADADLRAELAALTAIRSTMQAEEVQSPGDFGLARLMRDVEAERSAAPAPAAANDNVVPLMRLRIWQVAAAVVLAVGIGFNLPQFGPATAPMDSAEAPMAAPTGFTLASGETAQAKHQQQTKRANGHWQILSNRRGERAKPHPHTVAHTTQLSPQSPAIASAVVNENPSSFQPSTPPIISLTGSPS